MDRDLLLTKSNKKRNAIMKIAVLIKQTPQLSEVIMGQDGLQWPEAALAINPFDEYAVEEALRIKEKTGGTAVAISCGKSSSESVLRDALALGIDEAYLVEFDQYSTTDPQTNAYLLAAAIRKIDGIDLVLTGKQACDDDSALVPSSVAAYLDWPQIGFVKKFDAIEERRIIARRTTDTGYEVVDTSLPAVCSVVKEINEPRLPSLKGKMKAKKAEIRKLTPAELGLNLTSLISIKAIEPPRSRPAGEILTGETDQVVDKLIEKLRVEQLV
jgi:electron transfer flavoprotein beta subunit